MAAAEWQSLLQQSQDLVTQDYSNYPRVERTLPQLQQYADVLRSRTNRYRTPADQAAATRLLAQQGFDASRLTQEVVSLEIQPTIEDVFHAETTSVEEYLQQVEESTLLATIQEAQQDTIAAYDTYMEQAMARDWAANKRQLFGLIAPQGALGGPGGGGFGAAEPQPLIGRSAASGATMAPAAALRLSPKEIAYVEAVKKLAAAGGGAQQRAVGGLELVKEFGTACKANEERGAGHETPMSTCWALLTDELQEARSRGVTPSAGGRYTEALLAGARKHLERGHQQHVRATIARYRLAAERGADPDQLREVQAYVQVKFRERGALDFMQPGGLDTSWIQLFYCLRSGYDSAARRAAERCSDLGAGGRGQPLEGYARPLVDEWLRSGCRLSDRSAAVAAREAERLLRDKNGLRASLKAPYQALTCALLAGDARGVDALGAALQGAGLPAILSTIEDFMWAKLALVGAAQPAAAQGGGLSPSFAASPGLPGAPGAAGGYSLADLQADINRWPPQYYSKQSREPLLYVTVLLLSLQLGAALRFLWRDETTRPYRLDAVHMALALQHEGALTASGITSGKDDGASTADVAPMLLQYGRKFLNTGDSATALHYYWLAAAARGGSLAVRAGLLKELLQGGRDYGTLLGGGGPGARGGALAALVPDAEERRRLLEAVAYECQNSAQPEEAVVLYLAAERPLQALAIVNMQMSNAVMAVVDEVDAVAAGVAAPASERLKRAALRGAEAAQQLSGPAGVESAARRELEAFQQLCAIRDMLLAAKRLRYDVALQKLQELAFLPLERSNVEQCVRLSTQLHPALLERVQDVVAAAADCIAARRQGASREAAASLRQELEALTAYANSLVGLRLPQAVYRKLSEAQVFFS